MESFLENYAAKRQTCKKAIIVLSVEISLKNTRPVPVLRQ